MEENTTNNESQVKTCTLCKRETYENKDKCILHCEKNDWYELLNGEKKWNNEKVNQFWDELRSLIKDNNMKNNTWQFIHFIFPVFKYSSNINFKNKTPQTLTKDYNFFSQGEIINDHFKITSPLYFRSCTFLDDAIFEYISFERLTFKLCEFHENISLINCTFLTEILFYWCVFERRLIMLELKFSSSNAKIKFDNSKIKDRFLFSKVNCDNLILDLDSVHFDENSIVNITKVILNELYFKDLYNFSKIFQIINLKVRNKLKLENTSINNVTFTNCDFEHTKKIALYDISLNNVKFNNIKWGKINSDHFEADRDSIRQLKHANDQQGNYIQANKFYSFEMKKYNNEILEKVKKGKIEKYNLEWCVFTISKKLSNFSQNWILPIFWFIFLGSMFFDVLLLSRFNKYTVICATISIVYILKFLIVRNIIKTDNMQLIMFATKFLAINILFYIILDFYDFISINDHLWFINPLNTKTIPDNTYLINSLFIVFKLITIIIGYQLVTALRFHTRRK